MAGIYCLTSGWSYVAAPNLPFTTKPRGRFMKGYTWRVTQGHPQNIVKVDKHSPHNCACTVQVRIHFTLTALNYNDDRWQLCSASRARLVTRSYINTLFLTRPNHTPKTFSINYIQSVLGWITGQVISHPSFQFMRQIINLWTISLTIAGRSVTVQLCSFAYDGNRVPRFLWSIYPSVQYCHAGPW